MQEYKRRAWDEYNELTDRLEKLNNFLLKAEFSLLSKTDKDLLVQQAFYMTNYHDTLKQRIKQFKD